MIIEKKEDLIVGEYYKYINKRNNIVRLLKLTSFSSSGNPLFFCIKERSRNVFKDITYKLFGYSHKIVEKITSLEDINYIERCVREDRFIRRKEVNLKKDLNYDIY